ncbi:hypothetical protein HAHE_29240 [Haloferula helveola]|uniref:Transposase IS200-like domain-containing protein n=1 Tax=Haloferula helveola TaxID=490095 RepID=A0ABN6H5V4_9BACT|nr:hypothetical protein HAHE_29240 [Haloferula helveola]
MTDPEKRQGWNRRGYLPHLDVPGRAQGVTFRLADSLPVHVVEGWRSELAGLPDEEHARELERRVAGWEDACHGECVLRDGRCAAVVADALRFFDGERYHLIEWCVMPNHVHVLLVMGEGHSLGGTIGSWKRFTANRIHELLNRAGQLWAPDYHDRLIRDEAHLARAVHYVRMNPVKAGLCDRPEDWRWGSAWEAGSR